MPEKPLKSEQSAEDSTLADVRKKKKKEKHGDAEQSGRIAEAEVAGETKSEKKAKRNKVVEDVEEDSKIHKTKRKHSEDGEAQIDASERSGEVLQKKTKLDKISEVVSAVALSDAAEKVDWAARKREKKKRKRERELAAQTAKRGKKAQEKHEAKMAAVEEIKAKEKQNAKLKKKGKLTKKQKYLAAKAAKKAQASGEKPAGVQKPFNIEQALATAGIDRLDPKAVSCFLTGLPYMATDQHVADHFKTIGHCTVQLLQDTVNGRPNGTGFVNFNTAELAFEAATYTGSKIQGRWIKVRLCEPRDTGVRTRDDGPGEKPDGCLSVVVKCDTSISEASLKRFFKDCEVANVSRLLDKETGEFTGTAFLDFEDTRMVDKAVLQNGQSIKSFPLMVRYKMEKKTDSQKEAQAIARRGGVALHNRAPPVPAPAGKRTTLGSDSDDE